jgi:hypothetical protein
MTADMLDLARRAVACKGWRWTPGMLHGTAVGGELTSCYRVGDLTLYLDADRVPDLRDPATLGCLLALVREAWSAPRALVRLSSNGKSFHVFDVDRVTMGGNWAAFLCGDRILQTEAEALVAALEAAPVQ